MKCVVNKMKSEIVNKGLKLIEDASLILESISNKPGVTCYQFFEALDIAEIWCEDRVILRYTDQREDNEQRIS